MEFKSRKLDNGLTVLGEVNGAARTAAVGFFVRTGSRDETAEVSGVSHFLEHMLFKGTKELSALEVNLAFDRTGAKFNACTGEENTIYYAAVLPEMLEKVAGIWMKLMRPSLREDDFNMEKNVIKEEIAMYKDLPQFDVWDQCMSLHFGKHPCGNSVLGTTGSIDAMSAEQMRSYFASRYSPGNLVLAFGGNFDFEKMFVLAEQKCSGWENVPAGRKLADFAGSGEKKRDAKGNLVREHICLMSKAPSMQRRERFAASLLAKIIGDATGSRFFWRLVDTAVAETATMHNEAMDGTGILFSYIRCGAEDSQKVISEVDGIFSELDKDGVTSEELEKAKNKSLSALTINNERPMNRLYNLGLNWTYLKQYRTVQEDIEAIKSVTRDEVNELIRTLRPGVYTSYSIGPEKN